MDAVKFIEECRRMYKITGKHLSVLGDWNPAEGVVKEVEEWATAHPCRTRQNVFLEQWPEAKIDDNGCLSVCPYLVSAIYRDKYGNCLAQGKNCYDCRRKFWLQEVT